MTADDLEQVFATFDSPEDLFAWVRSSPEATSVFYERLLPLLAEPGGCFLYLNKETPAPFFAGRPAGARAHSEGGALAETPRGVEAGNNRRVLAEGIPCPWRPTGQGAAGVRPPLVRDCLGLACPSLPLH